MPRIVVLTGAGISAESGLPTFRGPTGMWEGHRVQDVATPEGFAANPELVQRFYNRLRRQMAQAQPNAAHHALARLERALGDQIHLVTQNIDDLHQRAGSLRITAMHGELSKIRHVDTGEILDWRHDVAETDRHWRPHVVWFGERTIGLDHVTEKLSAADIFVAVGTSGTVYPANQFAAIAKSAGAVTIEINIEPGNGPFDQVWQAPATQEVPLFVDHLIEEFGHSRRA
ncbi:NAD-dependent deacylase (plasmid) [Mycobacterium avium subsp. hominissuis]|uniref:NAD-dependent deacylase n=1 Tax=Mycobacterium avium TaxID=1764 RepID=UPI003140079B